jgi:NADPH:quinone reductase-like Zn-dependent oxidoreductase
LTRRVRVNRDNIDQLKDQLTKLGATHVLTYDDLTDKSTRDKIKQWTGGKPIRLGLNCVGGKETTLMARYLGQDAHLVSYGAMSKQPLSLPTSLFIFKNLTANGFWQSQWYKTRPSQERDKLMQKLVGYINAGKVSLFHAMFSSQSVTKWIPAPNARPRNPPYHGQLVG